MERTTFYTELAYPLGVAGLALETTFMEKADLGIPMVVAIAYLFYLKLPENWNFPDRLPLRRFFQ